MAQIGIPYELIGPDGTRAVFNDKADPDFVGFLDGENGVTGLDGADVRESAEDIVEGDGGAHGNFYIGRRNVTLQGMIDPDGVDIVTVMQREQRIKRASRALRADAVLRWQQADRPLCRLSVRRQSKPSISGRRPKQVQLAFVSADWRVYSDEEHALAALGSGPPDNGGLTFDMPFDIDFVGLGNGIAQIQALNTGDAMTPPTFRIDGPIDSPTLYNATTGKAMLLTTTLAFGEFLQVDVAARSILYNGVTNLYQAFAYGVSDWIELAPGNNDLRILTPGYSPPAGFTVYWRDAWE